METREGKQYDAYMEAVYAIYLDYIRRRRAAGNNLDPVDKAYSLWAYGVEMTGFQSFYITNNLNVAIPPDYSKCDNPEHS
jgi:hypothetical protein